MRLNLFDGGELIASFDIDDSDAPYNPQVYNLARWGDRDAVMAGVRAAMKAEQTPDHEK
jgi:hypothetical protein